jgi:hypothetical protein
MITLDLSDAINKLSDIQLNFNNAESPTTRYALLQALNYLAEHEIKFTNEHWVMKTMKDAMLREQGIEVKDY